MSDIDLNELLQRAGAVAVEAVQHLGHLDTVPYFYHFQETFPYMTWRVAQDEISDEGEELDVDNYLIIGRLVVAHVTEGYAGEGEAMLYSFIPVIKTAFNRNINLQTPGAFTAPMTHLNEARLGRHTGYKIFMDSGIKSQQIGCEFPLTCEFEQLIDYQYN